MLILQGERDYQATMVDFATWRKALASRKDVSTDGTKSHSQGCQKTAHRNEQVWDCHDFSSEPLSPWSCSLISKWNLCSNR